MPTGYTEGILTGKITTFPQFARVCMRGFGATIHLRDEDLDKEYIPRKPSEYHLKELNIAKNELARIKSLSDEEIIEIGKNRYLESKKYHLESIKKGKFLFKKLNTILKKVQKWQPPTKDHAGLKDFMIKQIEETIKHDCAIDYHEKSLININESISQLSAKELRESLIETNENSIKYYDENYKKDVEHCRLANKWVIDLLESIEKI